jgi:hypothetical protein
MNIGATWIRSGNKLTLLNTDDTENYLMWQILSTDRKRTPMWQLIISGLTQNKNSSPAIVKLSTQVIVIIKSLSLHRLLQTTYNR